VAQFRDVLVELARLKANSVVRDYAIAGSVAFSLWDEPVATQDLDVIVVLAGTVDRLDPLRPLLDWFERERRPIDGPHVVIAGVPVQFLVAWSPLVEEAVAAAKDVSYDPSDPESPTVRLVTPTYLVAMWQADEAANTARRRERAARLREAGLVDESLLTGLLSKTRK
jgi:hypothetical protein